MKTVIRSLTSTLRTSILTSDRARRRRLAIGLPSLALIDVLENRLLLAADLGDAPDPSSVTGAENYQTLVANNGPRHIIDQTQTTLFLGAGVDRDTAAQQSAGALADDLYIADGRDDEDGVLNPLDLQATVGTNPVVTIQATNITSRTATLYGWIDLNRNGVFENATERTQVTVPAGSDSDRFTLTFPMATVGAIGETYARFRLSTDVASANSVGAASDGEVEDYSFTIRNRLALPPSIANIVTTASGINRPTSAWPLSLLGFAVAPVGDLDQNGTEDYIVTDPADGGVIGQSGPIGAAFVVFQNSDGTVKQSVKLASDENGIPELHSDDLFGISISSLGDIDGDGVCDVAIGAPVDGTGGAERGAVYIVRLKSDGTVKSTTKIAHSLNGGPELHDGDGFGMALTCPGDMDGDGIGDLVVSAGNSDVGGEDRGVVFTMFLNADGTVRHFTAIENTSQWNPTVENEENFGLHITAIGDIDGNGVGDLASVSATYVGDGFELESVEKQIDLLLMNSDGTLKKFVGIDSGLSEGSGQLLYDCIEDITPLGDVDGDGVEDLGAVIGNARGRKTSRLQIITLTADGHAKSVEELNLPGSVDMSSLTNLGDTNHDGRIELAWGQPFENEHYDSPGPLKIVTLENATVRTNLPAVPVIDRSVTVTRSLRPRFNWNDSDDSSSYEVWIRNADTGAVIVPSAVVGTNFFTPPADLSPGTYSISVRARNEVGVSTWSARHSLLVSPVPDVNPVSTSMNRKPEFSWNRMQETSRYDVWISKAATPGIAVMRATTATAVTRFTPATALPSGTYRVQVREILANGTVRQWSDPRTFIIETKASIRSITSQISNRPFIEWDALAGAKKYDVWIASLDHPSRSPVRVTTTTAVTSYRPAALPTGRYQVWVRGISTDDVPGEWSTAKEFRSRMVPTMNPVSGALAIGSRVPFSWSIGEGAGASSYDVWVDDPAAGLTPLSSAVRTNSNTEYFDIKVIGTYRIWVRAIGSDGVAGAWSAPLFVKIDLIPGSLTFSSADVIHPEFRWSSVTGAIRYDVRVISKADGSVVQTVQKNATGAPFPAHKLVDALPIGNYEITVRAIAADGTAGSWSAPMAYNSTLAPELRPYQAQFGGDVILEWSPAANSGPIKLAIMNTTSKRIVYTGEAAAYQYNAGVVLPDGDYRWWAMATNHQMWSLPADFQVKRRAVFTNDTIFQTNTPVTPTWDEVDAAVRYEVLVTDERGTPVYRNLSVDGLQVTLQSTLPPGRYRAWVRAVSEDGEIGEWSNPLDFVVQPIT